MFHYQMLSFNTYCFSDLIFTFEIFEGSLRFLSGNGITADDYTFQGDILTIDETYVLSMFSSDPERETLILFSIKRD